MADSALAILESLRAARIQPDSAVRLLMYEARWPEHAAVEAVFGQRNFAAVAPAPRPCGCDDDDPDPGLEPPGTIEDLISALQQQVEAVGQEAAEMRAATATHEPVIPAEGGPIP